MRLLCKSDNDLLCSNILLESFRFHHDAQHFDCNLQTPSDDIFTSSLNLFSDPNIVWKRIYDMHERRRYIV